MGIKYDDLEELCETIGGKLTETNDKLRAARGDMTSSDVEYVDKLTHALKSIKTTMAMMEAEDGYSGDSMGGTSGAYPNYRYMGGRSHARNRDRMGRYSRGYSRDGGYSRDSGSDDVVEQLKELMNSTDDEQMRGELRKFVRKVEQM